MALKYENIGKNIFLNEFLYSVLAGIPSQVDQDIMREHFALHHSEESELHDLPTCGLTNHTFDHKLYLDNIFNL